MASKKTAKQVANLFVEPSDEVEALCFRWKSGLSSRFRHVPVTRPPLHAEHIKNPRCAKNYIDAINTVTYARR